MSRKIALPFETARSQKFDGLFTASNNSLSGFTEEDDIKWEIDAVRRAIQEVKATPNVDPFVIEERVNQLENRFPRGFKKMMEDDEAKVPKVVVHESKNELLMVNESPSTPLPIDSSPTSAPIETPQLTPPNTQPPDAPKPAIWRRLYDYGKAKASQLWNYLTL